MRHLLPLMIAAALAAAGLAAAEVRPEANLKDAAWLVGTWAGPGLGGQSEETWLPPAAGAMPGIFRLVKDGAVQFYEIMTIVEVEGSLELRLKHFHADLRGWEEKDKVLTFPLTRREPDKLHFGGIVYHRVSGDELEVTVSIRQRDGTVKAESLRFKRVRPA